MTREDFTSFDPPDEEPLVIAFIDLVRSRGFQTEISFGFWDFRVYENEDDPLIAVKSIKNKLSETLMENLVIDPSPFKVILMEGDEVDWKQLEAKKLFLSATGTGIYVRDIGWRTLPGEPAVEVVEDLHLKLAKDWKVDSSGKWRKRCRKCGEMKTPEDFYRSAYPTARDPYRNQCIKCHNAARWAKKEGNNGENRASTPH